MNDTILEIENVSKRYRYGKIGSGSIRQDLNQWWQKNILKKETSFYKGTSASNEEGSFNHFWALNNISFKVREGEVWGIIGQNGAGKSTLLKILSKITKPTTGVIRGRGKVSSLLEVGIGFQPELTGRENIYTSGHILGMKNREIRDKFDEIVDFSGVWEFIDTPVKRYSSGMYMRLAFAVAAYLDPDILIVDEVLAVGDAEFQKKCLSKMHEVSNKNGRTIIFVSHNLQAITNLCSHAIWLQKGTIKNIGNPAEVVHSYTASFKQDKVEHNWSMPETAPGNDEVRMKRIQVRAQTDEENDFITVHTPIEIDVEFWSWLRDCDVNVNVKLLTINGECVFNLGSGTIKADKGILVLRNVIPGNLLNNNTYTISLIVVKNNSQPVCEFSDCISFEVEDDRQGINYFGPWPGIIRPQIESSFYIKEPAMQVYT